MLKNSPMYKSEQSARMSMMHGPVVHVILTSLCAAFFFPRNYTSCPKGQSFKTVHGNTEALESNSVSV